MEMEAIIFFLDSLLKIAGGAKVSAKFVQVLLLVTETEEFMEDLRLLWAESPDLMHKFQFFLGEAGHDKWIQS